MTSGVARSATTSAVRKPQSASRSFIPVSLSGSPAG
jgi:hypothetical protein